MPFLAITLSLFLSGCDAYHDLLAEASAKKWEATSVIHPGNMLVGGKPTFVLGSEKCPESDGEYTCTLIAPETKQVAVTLLLATGPSREIWTVERGKNRAVLRRADGSYLGQPY
jgi:hypothetical protein